MRDLKQKFGNFVQCPVDKDPTNTMEERTFDAIVCRPSTNEHGGIFVYDIAYKSIRKQTHAILVHQNDDIANRISEIAEHKNSPLRLIFRYHNRNVVLRDMQDDDSTTDKQYNDDYNDQDEKNQHI